MQDRYNHCYTNPLNRELENRLRARIATSPRYAAEPVVQEAPVEGDLVLDDTSSVDAPSQQLEQLYAELMQAHRQMKNLSGELTRRKLNDGQIKDLGVVEDWLYVTKGIARQYGESLIRMEQALERLADGVAGYRAQYGRDPQFMSE